MNTDIRANVTTLAKALTLAAGASVTLDDILDFGTAERKALDWDIATASPSLKVEIIQANSAASAANFTEWATDLTGLVPTNDFTLTTQKGGSNLRLSDSRYGKLKLTNTGVASLTINELRVLLA
jgi:hypothetical protein